ncbi:MAG: helix-turn-helix domain-containing protein [Xanthobacteraceae bacterium]|nr:helix-turn-helix domain-containing protein [Xanthobacteraceae bacterium]
MIEREADSDSPPPFDLRVSAHEFEFWCWASSPDFGVAAQERQRQREFTMQATGSHFAGMAVVRTTSIAARFERTRGAIARSGIDTIIFQLSLKGCFRFDADRQTSEVRAGDIAVFDLSRPASITAEPYEIVSVILKRSLLSALISDFDGMHGLVLRAETPLNELLKSHMMMLHAQARRTTTAEHTSTARGTAALLAACVGPSANGRDAAARSVAFSLLQAMRNAIDQDLGNPELNADRIGAQFGVSRASLYRAFEPMGGVRNYIRHRRLMRSYLAISDPNRAEERISTIAQQCGFNNDAVFSRAFRELYGMTPSEVRAAARCGHQTGAQHDRTGEKSFWSLNRWLLGLEANRIVVSSVPLAPAESPPEGLRPRSRRTKPAA